MNKLVLLIPGIMGSELAYESYKVWPRFFPTNIGVYDKYLPIGEDDNIQPAGLLSFSYRNAYNYLCGIEGVHVEPFAYDWRKDNLSTVERLHERLERIHTNYEEIYLVAHSMGGLLSKILLNVYFEESYIEKINKLITVGTPWHGSLDAYKTLKYGKSIPDTFPHSIVLTKEKSKTLAKQFPSIYQLFPDESYEERLRNEYGLPILHEDNKDVTINEIFNREDVVSQFVNLDVTYELLISAFKEKINSSNEQTNHIEHHEIIGVGITTLSSIDINNRNEANAHFKNGDGTVPIFSAKSDFANNRYYVKNAKHDKLVKNHDSLKIIEQLISGTEVIQTENVLLTDEEISEIGFKSKIVRIACPVDVTILKNGNPIYGFSDSFEYHDNELTNELSIFTLDNTVYLIDENGEELEQDEIVIEAYDEGETSITIEQYGEDQAKQTVAFETFVITPSTRAKLKVDQFIANSELLLKDENGESLKEPRGLREEVSAPKTSFIFCSGNIYIDEGNYVITNGETLVKITNVENGTNDVSETYISLNGKLIRVENYKNPISLDLQAGENIIKVFSSDIYGNEETVESIELYYMEDVEPRIEVEILPHQYKISINENEKVNSLIEKRNLPGSKIVINGETDEKVFYSPNSILVIKGEPKIREFSIYYDMGIGRKDINISIDEFNIANIFEGTATTENIEELLKGLNVDIRESVTRISKLEGAGKYRKITNENLANMKELTLKNNYLTLTIVRRNDFILSFHELKEDLKITEDVYRFRFKLFNNNNEEIRTARFTALLKVIVGNEERFIEDINITFNQQSDLYEGIFKVVLLREILKGYWETTEICSSDLIILKQDNVVRTKEITIRKE